MTDQLPALNPVKPLGPVELVLEAAEIASRLGNEVLQCGDRDPRRLAAAKARLKLATELVHLVECYQGQLGADPVEASA